MMFCLRASVFFLALGTMCVPTVCAEEPALDWRPLPGAAEPQRELIDCRSPIIAHEQTVQLGEAWKLGDHAFTFTRDERHEGRLIVSHTLPGQTRTTASTIEPPTWHTFEFRSRPYAVSLRWATDKNVIRVSSATGLAVPFAGRNAFIVDSDLDGALGSKGDGIVVPGSRTIGAFRETSLFYAPDGAVAVRKHETEGWQYAALPMPREGDDDHAGAWRLLQWHRQAAGLLPLTYDESLEKGMKLHIDYLVRNNRYSHYEDPQLPGYTEEGARAGLTSVIGKLKKSHVDGISSQLTSLFHRSSCLAPELEISAMVLERTHFMCSTKIQVRGALSGSPLVYPAHGMTEVPCEFNIAGESPLPFEGEAASNKRGTAVGVRFAQLSHARSLTAEPVLTLEAKPRGGQWHEVRCDFYHPGRPPRSAGVPASYLGHVALVPKQFLAPGTLHRARLAMPRPRNGAAGDADKMFIYEWEFTTGESRR